MMTRFTLTMALGVLLSLGTLVTGGFSGQAQADNWNPKNGQEFGMPEIRISTYYSNHATSDFNTFAQRLGHLSVFLLECSFHSDMTNEKLQKIDTEFLEYASPRDQAEFRGKRNIYYPHTTNYKVTTLSKTQCNQTLVSEVINIIDKTISWLKENPGSNLPELSEWQSKILKKADVGVTQVASVETAVEKRLQELGALTIEPTFTPANGNTDSLGKQLTLSETLEPPQYVGHMFWWASLCKGHRLEGNYNKEWTESFKRLASKKDWALFKSSSFMSDASNPIPKNCSPEKVNKVNAFLQETLSWLERNEGSNLSNYFKGQSDGVTQAASVGTTSSNKPSGGLVMCERYRDNEPEFRSRQINYNYNQNETYDSFFPKKLEIEVRSFEGVPGRSALISKNQTLTKSGKLLLRRKEIAAHIDTADYKCDKTSLEVAALLDKLEKQPVTEVVKQQTPTQENDPFAEAKAFCSDLGFASGTEKHGNCVLKIASNSGSEVAPATSEPETVSNDNKPPTITIASALSNGPEGTVKGRVTDKNGIAEVRVDGQVVQTDSDGNFTASTYVPKGGVSVSVKAVNLAGLSSSMSVKLKRNASNTVASISFERLNPLGRKVAKNKDALALIIGVDGYSKTPARAIYADSDAEVFADYASQKLGIPANRIKTLVNDGADVSGMLLAVKDWLSRASKKDKSDVYVFFAGHGLASQDGKKMYLLPYDGSPRLLEKTAILRDELFSDIASTNPRSVTVFLDTCYSGETRGNEMLIAGRPIGIRVLEQSIPDNFTLMTAAAGDQIANPLKEAKHGMFSYFLMKGMEGVADSNQDNKITALELHEYVKENVWQQSSNKQLPELQGDENRVLVQFQ